MPDTSRYFVRRAVLAGMGALMLGLPSLLHAQATASTDREPQWWKGSFEAQGMTLDFVVAFRPTSDSDGYTATIDIPVQGAKNLALSEVVLTPERLGFAIPPPPGAPAIAKAVFELRREEDGRTANGTLQQSGFTFAVRMERVTEEEARAVGPPRPQTPKPPFPYEAREVTYQNPVDDTRLAGTLTIPPGSGPHPAVILITGSGAQDRDETLFGHKPFMVWADHLTRHGIAVLRMDDRGVGGSSGSTADSTSKDFANDVIAGLKFLQQQPEIDRRRLGLVGHSEGGIIAPLVASKSKDVACMVLLGGPALPGAKLLNLQLEALVRAAGLSEADIERQSQAQRKLIDLVVADAEADAVRDAARELIRVQFEALDERNPSEEQLDGQTKVAVAQVSSPWMRWFLKHDPREVLVKVKCPTLALIGSLDLQVPPKENVPELAKAFRQAGNTQATVKELPGLNHLFQPAKTGLVAEYAAIDQTLAPAVLDEVTSWLREQLKVE